LTDESPEIKSSLLRGVGHPSCDDGLHGMEHEEDEEEDEGSFVAAL